MTGEEITALVSAGTLVLVFALSSLRLANRLTEDTKLKRIIKGQRPQAFRSSLSVPAPYRRVAP